MSTFIRTREYDLFGPWIDEVKQLDDVPRLYADHPFDFEGSRLILKVPRNIAHRDATPEMDLYDHMLIVGKSGLTVLSRVADPRRRGVAETSTFTTREIAFADIAVLRNRVNLLDARFSITGRDGAVIEVKYNGSAGVPITDLVDLLRSEFGRVGPVAVAPTPQLTPLEERDAALMVDFKNAARRLPDLTPWAWHERRTLRPRAGGISGLAKRVALASSPATLHGAVIGADAKAFEAFGRRDWLLRGRAPELSSGRLVIPLAAIDAVEVAPHPVYKGVATVTFASGRARTDMHVPEDSPTLAALTFAFGSR